MSARRITWQGTLYVSVHDAASCYGLTVAELERWVVEELIQPPEEITGVRALPARALDRIAVLVRYTRLLGLDAAAIRTLEEMGRL